MQVKFYKVWCAHLLKFSPDFAAAYLTTRLANVDTKMFAWPLQNIQIWNGLSGENLQTEFTLSPTCVNFQKETLIGSLRMYCKCWFHD